MKHMKNIKYGVAVLVALLFDFTLAAYLKIGGALPQFTFCLCILSAMFENDECYAVSVAAVAGAAADALSGHGFGTYMICFALSAYAVYSWGDSVFSLKPLFLVPSVFILTVLSHLLYNLLHYTVISDEFAEVFVPVILGGGVYNSVLCLIFYPLFKRVFVGRR